MNILILNWRDIKNPSGGGAEILTQEIAKRWVSAGNHVVLFTAAFAGSKSDESVDGVKIIRKGSWWNVHIIAFFYYLFFLRNTFDVVIDEVHWFPFFANLYAGKKTILLACEVADKLFSYVLPFPFSLIGRLLEKLYLYLYRNVPTLAISPSTKEDLIRAGFQEKNISVLPMGLTIPRGVKKYNKEKGKTLIFLGRLNKQKGIEDALSAFRSLSKENIVDRLWVVGSVSEEYVKELKNSVKDLSASSVVFFGFVDEVEKFNLLSKAHILIVPSIHEGWGLTVSEAGYVGTPAVVYRSRGLCDTITDGENGFLVDSSPEGLVVGVRKAIEDEALYARVRTHAIESAKLHDWEQSADIGIKFLQNHFSVK